MVGYEKFHETLLRTCFSRYMRRMRSRRQKLGVAFLNELFDQEGPRTVGIAATREDIFFDRFYRGFREIDESYENLVDAAETYVGRYPFGRTRVSRVRYIRYVIESYLNELYVLKERLIAYFSVLGRLYRGTTHHGEILRATRPLFGNVRDVLKEIIDLRGSHVHQTRFKDQNLSRLNTIEFFNSLVEEDEEWFKVWCDVQYREIRNDWKKSLKEMNKVVKALLDSCFESLYPVIFDNRGNVRHVPR